MQCLTPGRHRRRLRCIMLALHTFELQEHQHDCTPNDLLAAYAALALRPLATPASASLARGCALLYAWFYTLSTQQKILKI